MSAGGHVPIAFKVTSELYLPKRPHMWLQEVNMSTVGIRELKTNTSEIVRRVRESGEVIDITHRGEVVARLIPARPAETTADELAALWADMDRLTEEISERWTGTPSAVDAVREGRREL